MISKSSFPQKGILAALWTPTDSKGRLLKSALKNHLAFLQRSGVHGVLALGSTGEFIRFDLKQREAILTTVAELAGSLPVVANISAIRLDEVVTLGKTAKRVGVRGVALMPPHFFPMSQADILEFLLRAAEAVKLPFALYNFPELTGNRLNLETIAAFADRAPMAAIKQSGGEFTYHQALIQLGREKRFAVFSGADTRLPEVFALGALGCVGGLVNFVPDLMVNIFNGCQTGDAAAVLLNADRMKIVGQIVDRLTFPLNVAAGMEARGFEPGAPKTVVSAESKRLYREIAKEFRQQFKAWNL